MDTGKGSNPFSGVEGRVVLNGPTISSSILGPLPGTHDNGGSAGSR
jgi:hypothetical protein